MNNFETPIDFSLEKHSNNCEVSFSQLMETTQGGPVVGFISIKGIQINQFRFGGPILIEGSYVFAPVFIKKFCFTGFKIAKINIENMNISLIGKIRNVICLEYIENDSIYFYLDLEKTNMNSERIL